MEFRELFQIGLDALLANKLRTFLTALGIIIGTASVIAMLAIGSGAKASVEDRISSLGANLITVTAGSSRTGNVAGAAGSSQTLILDDYTAIKDALGSTVKGVTPEQSSNQQVIYRDKNTNVSVTGTADNYLGIRNYTLKDGAYFSELQNDNAARVAVLGSSTATTLFGTDDPIGKQIQISNQIFTVIGVLNAKGQSGFQSQDDLVLVPYKTSQRTLTGTDVVRSIVAQLASQDSSSAVQLQITALLYTRHNVNSTNQDFTVSSSQDTLETLSSVSNTFTLLLAGIASISLLVGGIGIMNTMIISITERTREIGLRKAIGAKDRLILLQFLIESIVLSGLGAFLGIILGIAIAVITNATGLITARITLEPVILSASISVIVGLVFGIYPARQASRLSPIVALKYE